MKNHPLYQQLKQIVLDGDYTVDQACALNINQAAELLGSHSFSLAFLNNMKRGIVMELQGRDDEIDLQQLKEAAKNWLDVNFPDWEAEHGREGEKPYVTIWLKGKP
jgi:hypothetical protein